MKILAIRGRNLASLSGTFDIDFGAEPLASAGLFAITGPTGAGKSTLLDALCLALYEKTPRLGRATGRNTAIPDVGDDSVTPADPRTLLRRGASDGFAEVDFVGSDGQAYRARWLVRRARNRTQGRLQATELTLTRLHDGQAQGGGTKSETLKRIEERVGLSFEQFTRAVLLAQNDFATFLKSSDDERAELLQTLTGTETFSRISVLAFERMRAERQALEGLQARLDDMAPLAPDARLEVETQLQVQRGLVQDREAQLTRTQTLLQWHQSLARLQAQEVQAQQAHAAAAQARDGAQDRFRQLERVEAAQVARPLCSEVDRIDSERAACVRNATESRERLAGAELAIAARQQAVEQTATTLEQAEQAKAQAQAQLAAARTLDTQLEMVRDQCRTAHSAHGQGLEQRDAAVQRASDTARTLGLVQDDLAVTRDWLQKRVALAPLAQHWTLWEALFQQASGLRAEQRTVQERQQAHDRQARNLAATLAKAQAEQARLAAAFDHAGVALNQCAQHCQAYNLDALAQTRQQLETRRDQLQAAAQVWKDCQDLHRREQALQHQQQTLQVGLEAGQRLQGELQRERPALEQAARAAEQALRIAELAASDSAEALRAQLQPDAPCPVCGALAHPYAHETPQVNAILTGLRQHLEDARNALSLHEKQWGANEAHLATSRQQLQQHQAERLTVAHALAAERQKWHGQPLHGECGALDEAALAPWLAEQWQATREALAGVQHSEAQGREALRAHDLARRAHDQARAALHTSTQGLATLDTQQQTLGEARKALAQRQQDISTQLDEVLTQLDAAFPDAAWREHWRAEPAALAADCKAQVDDWNRRQRLVVEREQQSTTLTATLAGMAEAVTRAQEQEQALRAQREQHDRRQAELGEARAALLDGRPVEVVESGLAQAIDAARAQLDQARQDRQDALAAVARLQEATRQADARLVTLDAAQVQAQQALDAWLENFRTGAAGAALGVQELRQWLALGAGWIASERSALQALTQAEISSAAVLQTHQVARAQHETSCPAGAEATSATELEQVQAQSRADLEAAREAFNGLKRDIERDNERLEQTRALRLALDQQAARSQTWSRLGDLIGSADGRKFRNFAQQFTLDILLAYANRHLETLARRYRLLRITDSLGLMVVDQEMGDEVRSVHSLSGGESFLVSLGLALGLASLSSHRVRVESLFIDEGFGSLDAEALNVAMEALDKLQALGRKVGVISHVQEMTERIATRIQIRRQSGGASTIVIA